MVLFIFVFGLWNGVLFDLKLGGSKGWFGWRGGGIENCIGFGIGGGVFWCDIKNGGGICIFVFWKFWILLFCGIVCWKLMLLFKWIFWFIFWYWFVFFKNIGGMDVFFCCLVFCG